MDEQISLGQNPKNSEPYTVILSDHSVLEKALLKQFLQAEGFKVIFEAEDGQTAIDCFRFIKPPANILIIDYEMPKKNALEVVKELRPNFPELFIAVVTSHTDKNIIAELVKYKINSYIVKPYQKAILREKLATMLGRQDLLPKTISNQTANTVKSQPNTTLKLDDLFIPPLSNVATKVMAYEGDASAGSSELEQILLPDRSLCADLLRVANSTYYGRSGKIKNLKEAIVLLGTKTIKNIALVQSKKHMSKSLTHSDLFKKYLYELPTLTGLVAMDLCNPLGQKKLMEDVFLPAMISKTGMTILALNAGRKYADLLKKYEEGGGDLLQMEKKEFGLDSNDIALRIFKLWNIPKVFMDIVSKINFPEDDMHKVNDTIRIIRLAESLSKGLIHLNVSEEEVAFCKKIIKYYKAKEETLSLFDEIYYRGIQSHPFFEAFQ